MIIVIIVDERKKYLFDTAKIINLKEIIDMEWF